MTLDAAYNVICPVHDKVQIGKANYDLQMSHSDDWWYCPICGKASDFDEDSYERYFYPCKERIYPMEYNLAARILIQWIAPLPVIMAIIAAIAYLVPDSWWSGYLAGILGALVARFFSGIYQSCYGK